MVNYILICKIADCCLYITAHFIAIEVFFSLFFFLIMPCTVSGIIGLHHFSYYIGDNVIKEEMTGSRPHVVVSLDSGKLVSDVHRYAVEIGMISEEHAPGQAWVSS